MLSVRAYKIALKLLTMDREITIKELSELFDVSERTIRYDLEHIKDFFQGIEIELVYQSGKGYWIHCNSHKKMEAMNILSKISNESMFYNQELRAQKILIELFSENRFFTANELSEKVNVNRNTVFGDMDYIDMIVDSSDLYLMRTPRKGFSIGGTELEIRSFYERLIYKGLSVYDIYLMTENIKGVNTLDNYEIGLPYYLGNIYFEIEKTIRKYVSIYSEVFMKENIILIIIRVLISIHRVRNNCLLGECTVLCRRNSENGFEVLFAELCRICGIAAYKNELLFIENRFNEDYTRLDIGLLATELITSVSEKSGVDYYDDATLYSRLLSHLTLSLKDTRGDIELNPFNENIVKNHFELFSFIKEVCGRHIKNTQLTNSESFISYIALHFLISQRNLAKQKKFKGILVCATGRGAARIISRMIESEVKELHILGSCSLMDVEKEVDQKKPDYIISVFPIKSHVPVIIIDPIPTKENLRIIQKEINDKLDKDILNDDKLSSILKFDEKDKNSEEISQDIIIMGLSIFNKLGENGIYQVKEGRDFAYLTHIMLLAHRYYFKNQYTKTRLIEFNEEAGKLAQHLNEINISLTLGEAEALLNFFEGN